MMKPCPYCAEEIQEKAIKCRFCGEWVDKPIGKESVKELFSKGLSFGLKKIKEVTKKSKDLTLDDVKDGIVNAKNSVVKGYDAVYGDDTYLIPTDSEPLKYDNLSFYESYFTVENRRYLYEDITSVESIGNYSSTNVVLTFTSINLRVCGKPEGVEIELFNIAFGSSSLILNLTAKIVKKVKAISSYIQGRTNQQIRNNYIKELNEKGLIEYENVIIRSDGRVTDESDLCLNIKEAYKAGRLWIGLAKSGIFKYKPSYVDDGSYKKNYKNDPYKVLIKGDGFIADKINIVTKINTKIIQSIILQIATSESYALEIDNLGNSEVDLELEKFTKEGAYVFSEYFGKYYDYWDNVEIVYGAVVIALLRKELTTGQLDLKIMGAIVSDAKDGILGGVKHQENIPYKEKKDDRVVLLNIILLVQYCILIRKDSSVDEESLIQLILHKKAETIGVLGRFLEEYSNEKNEIPELDECIAEMIESRKG